MIKITIKQGSITEEAVDAVVNPANSYGLMGGGVAGAIKRVGGAIIEAEAVKSSPIKIGDSVMTSAGLLQARFVIHAPTMERPAEAAKEENIKKAVRAALKAADENKLEKVAMPGMGTGVGGFEPIDAARIIISEIKSFKADFLREVILVDMSEIMVKAFLEAMKQ